ncbi:MAG: hypothetical protein N2255_06865 [Kiritimatiellae bacterium]|nr:hypothetical protein [Kiritimatiellia bacterium]
MKRWFSVWVATGLAATGIAAELKLYNHSVLSKIYPEEFKEPLTALLPLRLVGARNGTYADQLVVVSTEPIAGLKATATSLSGPAELPATVVAIRYGLADGEPRVRGGIGYFDSLDQSPPEEVPVYSGSRLAIQPVWIAISVPPAAKPGTYTGRIVLGARGTPRVEVPVSIEVLDWTLPDPNEFTAHMDIVESPDSVALAYGVEMWSEAHLQLLDRTFALLKPLAVKTLFIPCVRRTHFGNEHAMVRWVWNEKTGLEPNFEWVEKYLDVAVRHLGKVPGVILYCWEPMSSMGHAGGTGSAERTHDRPILLTVWDPVTGELKKRTGPAWGTPECRELWKKLTDGIKPVLRKRGLEGSLMFGLIGDARPTKVAMDDICNGVENARWAVHSHHYCPQWQGYEVGMCVALWGIHLNIVDPDKGYGYGWQNPFWLAYYPREFSLQTPLANYRYKLEMWTGAFSLYEKQRFGKSRTARGLGRIGADFWKVIRMGNQWTSIAGRYPESYWGQLNLNYCLPYILGRGSQGPLPTVRSEAFREAVQDYEARAFIEKALVLEEHRARLGEDLTSRARSMLDDRIRMVNRAGGARKDQVVGVPAESELVPSDWRAKNELLYRMAAEFARKLGR